MQNGPGLSWIQNQKSEEEFVLLQGRPVDEVFWRPSTSRSV